MVKLHLGCGNKILDGWVNVDIQQHNPSVKQDDVGELGSIVDSSVDVIYASHVLEHFGRKEVEQVLQTWCRKLKPGGTLRISVPDFEAVCNRYAKFRNISELLGFISGGQKDKYDYHKMVFDFQSISLILNRTGFTNVVRYDWRQTEHSSVDDYSQAYLPHMDKTNGTLMSLNVEAIKL